MSINDYYVYADESGTHGSLGFALGGLRCSPERSQILRAELALVREEYGLTREMKWTRVSSAMLPAYRAYVDVILRTSSARFWLYRVRCGPEWVRWGRNEEERFFKSYYVFLRRNLKIAERYWIRVDDLPTKTDRWTKVVYSINNGVRRDYSLRRDLVKELVAVDSRTCDILQAIDVILGGLTSLASANAKVSLAAHIREGFASAKGCRLSEIEWSPSAGPP